MVELDDETRRSLGIEIPSTWVLAHAKDRYESIKVEFTEASFPRNTAPPDLPEHILLETSVGKIPLRTKQRLGASGNTIFVARDTLRDVPENETVSFKPISKSKYRRYWALRGHLV